MTGMRNLFLTAGLASIIGCEHTREELIHPIDDETVALVVPAAGGTTSEIRRLLDFKHRMDNGRIVIAIGTSDGAPETLFSDVRDIAVGTSGDFYVLDAQANEIRVFDRHGAFKGAFGQPGQGPNEFRNGVALVLANSGEVVLGTRSEVKYFSGSGAQLEYERSLQVGVIPSPRDMCSIGGDLFIRAYDNERKTVVTAVDAAGDIVKRFGAGYAGGSWLAQQQLSDGFVACTDDRVIVAFNDLPIVQAYTADGRLSWSAKVAHFEGQRVIETITADGKPQLQPDSQSGGDRILGIAGLPDGIVMIHVGRIGPSDPADPAVQPVIKVETFAVSSVDGSSILMGDGYPLVLNADSDRIYGVVPDETRSFPRVIVMELAPRIKGTGNEE
jgi:hypothetical protein